MAFTTHHISNRANRSIYLFSTPLLLLLLLLLASLETTNGFAAKRPSKKKSASTASTRKGFGAKAPTLAEVLAGFKTRIPENGADLPCPCKQVNAEGIVPLYRDCCQPYHAGVKTAETPLRVLQSRYSAFDYRIIPYIMLTTHHTCQYWRKDAVAWASELNSDGTMDTFEFLSLTVLPNATASANNGKDTRKEEAWIDFRVHVRSKMDGEETILKEKSLFLKQGDRWLYASGEARPEPVLKQQQKEAYNQ